jgi:hypothetical protein
MYLAAATFYGQLSAFDDTNGYAGSPPVKYLKALFTDYLAPYCIFIECDISTLPLVINHESRPYIQCHFIFCKPSHRADTVLSSSNTWGD